MKITSQLPALPLLLLLSVSGASAAPPESEQNTPKEEMISSVNASSHEAILLVSLQDGTVIKQSIDVGADICFKQSSSSLTTCLTQGDAIVDPVTNTIIGFEMIEDHIDLVAKID